jgi:hypothetical protein
MRQYRSVTALVTAFILMAGCTADAPKPSAESQPSTMAQAETGKDQPTSGEIQERAVPRKQPGMSTQPALERTPAKPMVPSVPAIPPTGSMLPGEFAIYTYLKSTYITALGGGGRTVGAMNTLPNSIGPYQRFKLWWAGPQDPQHYFIQTYSGNFLTAVGGGGRTTDVFHTDATQALDWEKFRFGRPSGVGWGTIQTVKGNYVTALGGGGKAEDAAFHTDAVQISVNPAPTWEWYYVQKCGDLGPDMEYAIYPSYSGTLWNATAGGGRVKGAIGSDLWENGARFKFIRQPDGSYALQTPNGVNYVTAIQGGGLANGTATWDTLVTDRTQVQAWEKFKIVDDGHCMYTIQTVSGFYVGWGGNGISTRISDPNAAPQIGYNAKFKLLPYGRW